MSSIDRRSFRGPETHKTELDAKDKKVAATEVDQAATGSVPLDMEDPKEDIPKDWRKDKSLPQFLRHKYAMKEKLEGKPWQPRNRVSREVMNEMKRLSEMVSSNVQAESIMLLNVELNVFFFSQKDPEKWNAKTLAVEFKKSPEAIRRILKSRYIPK
jgi:hypothetical protein